MYKRFIILYISFFTDAEGAREYYGKLVGQLTTYAHKVSGKVFAVDEDTLFIKDFTYDGLGPGIFKTYIVYSKYFNYKIFITPHKSSILWISLCSKLYVL